MKIALSELDQERFGVVTAKIAFDGSESVNDVMRWCEEKKVELLIARIPTDKIHLVQEAEQAGGFLTDTLVYFVHKNTRKSDSGLNIDLPRHYTWRVATPDDAESVGKLAEKIFDGYSGHYHADSQLKKSDCDLVYSSWASNTCLYKHFADVVFFVERESKPVGFIAIKKCGADGAEIVLNGVHPDCQGKGLYQALVMLAKEWTVQEQLKHVIVATQVTNLAVQKVWCRQGFEPQKSFYTFHHWFSK